MAAKRKPGGRARGGEFPPTERVRADIERHLARTLREHGSAPARVGEAMRYAALGPGKRLRPLLVLAASHAVGGDWRAALPAAAAIECVHAFSLVHDDLPAMDDDDYRRGRLTTHRRYGEAMGVLAGDALLAFAFEELSRLPAGGVPAARALACVTELATASGAHELIAGQALDVAAEGTRATRARVRAIHERKTGALMGCALALGATCGGARADAIERLREAGRVLGLAFQIQDDLLNARSSLKALGKRAGSDEARGKATWVRAVGEGRAEAEVGELLAAVRSAVVRATRRPEALLALIEATARRDH